MADAIFGEGILSERRARIAGPIGYKGLIHNKKTFGIAVFASLGGLVYGYNQGMFSQILTMHSFQAKTDGYAAQTGTAQGLLTSILELGAWLGSLANGYFADALGRRGCTLLACVVFIIGVIVQACVQNKNYIFAGRFVTGLGVGSLSMIVPLYNAELAPPEVRGSLVALQQLAITFGILVSYWIGYGTNFIGGHGANQSDAAYLIPICIQIVPAIILGAGMLVFMPQSPRHLMNRGQEEECQGTLALLRNASVDDILVQVEFLEIKALREFEVYTAGKKYPQWQDGSWKSGFLIGVNEYRSLITNKSLFRRTCVACLIMVFQQWNGINAVNYYAPYIFSGFGLSLTTTSLLATGVVGVMQFTGTIPAVLWVDRFGRKNILISGALAMAACHFIIAGIVGSFSHDWLSHRAGGWVAVVFVWLYAFNFNYSWGPVAWILISEVFPLSMRAKGVGLGGSSNWLNNFAVALSTSKFIGASAFGTFIFFGCMTLAGGAYVYLFVPETKGRTLEEMDELFGTLALGREDAATKARIEQEVGLYTLLGLEGEASGKLEAAATEKAGVQGQGETRVESV